MNTPVFFSIIIPTYNREHFLSKTIKSFLEQTFTDFEWLIIDDGSTDNSYELALEYFRNNLSETQWKLSKHSNCGINKTLNEAIQNSSGEIIYPLASDDRMPEL